jgi:hypothetical protein
MEEELLRCKKRIEMRVDGKCILKANIDEK